MYHSGPTLRLAGLALLGCLAGALTAAPAMAKLAEHTRLTLPHVAQRLARAAPLRIVAFGSSSTEGVGASSAAATYPNRLKAWLQGRLQERVDVVNAGIGGEDADDMMIRLARDVVPAKPDLVIWQTGTNDPLRKLPLDRFIAETRAGILQMRMAGIDVVLMEPQDCRMMRATPGAFAYLDAVRQIGADLRVPVVRRYDMIHRWLADGTVTETQLMAPDGLHMADEGYARLAAEVARELVDAAKPQPKAPATMVKTASK